MKCLRLVLLMIFLICVVPCQSHASVLEHFRKLAREDHNTKSTNQMSPSSSPVPETNLSSGNDQTPASPPQADSCDAVYNKCEIVAYSVAACVPFVGNESQASYLLVLNDAEKSLNVTIVVRPANTTFEDVLISGHKVKKVNLPSNTGSNSSILLTVGNSDCLIQIGAPIPQGSSYTRYLTPIGGAYLFFATSILVGGTWACCKYKKTRRHLDGVPYQELEMGQQETNPSFEMGQQETNPSFEIGSPEGWDSNWDDDDDDWDEEKAVRSPGARKALEKGAPLMYIDTSQWGSDWED